MNRSEMLLTIIGVMCSVLAVIVYVIQIFRMPRQQRSDFHNLVKPKGTWRSNPVNFIFLIGVIFLLISFFVK